MHFVVYILTGVRNVLLWMDVRLRGRFGRVLEIDIWALLPPLIRQSTFSFLRKNTCHLLLWVENTTFHFFFFYIHSEQNKNFFKKKK